MNAILQGFAEPTAYLDVGHSELAYYRFGDTGPDLFFVHGWPVDSRTFRHVLPFLTSRFRCHLVDLPGAGRTRCSDDSQIDIAVHGATVRRAIDQLGLKRFALVAHDSGGVVARVAAAGDPRVTSLVVAGSEIPGFRPWLIQAYAALARVPMTDRLMQRLMALRAVRTSPLGFGGCFTNADYTEGEFRGLFIDPMLGSLAVLRKHMALMRTLDFARIDELADVHARIQAPTRLIWGTDDPFFPIELARNMATQFAGGAEFVEIAGGKLFCQEDHPEEFARHTVEFLDRHATN
jgi:pimeloyl-ACP methyl ester carboxylesterase